jgi:hypothetical protein
MIGSEPLAATQAMAISAGVGAGVLGDRDQRVENCGAVRGVFLLENPSAKPFAPALFAQAVFAGQHAAAERGPGDNAEAKRLASRQKLLLGRAFDKAMLNLKSGDRRNAAQFGDGRGASYAPRREVGKAGVEDLSGSDEIIEPTHDFFERRHTVGNMGPVEVDPIGFQPLEARLDRRDHRLAAVAGDEDASFGIGSKTELRRQHEVIAASREEVAQAISAAYRVEKTAARTPGARVERPRASRPRPGAA